MNICQAHSIYLSQSDYISSIAKKLNVSNTKLVYTPLLVGVEFRAINQPEMASKKEQAVTLPYCEIIRSLMFAATVTHPDIAYLVNNLVQYSSNPGHRHWELANRSSDTCLQCKTGN
jgi:hypothetical protein